MKVYNQLKTQILETYDLEKGYLKNDKILTRVPEVKEVKEVGHFETIAVYPNGGKDVRWIVDIPRKEYVPSKEIEEEIFIYIPYTNEEIRRNEAKKQIELSKKYLSDTDYICCKLSEAISKYIINNDPNEIKNLLTKYDEILNNRKMHRQQISILELSL